MITASEIWLIAAAVFPILGAIGSLVGTLVPFPNWGLAASRTGLVGGCVCSAVLAILLYSHDFNALLVSLLIRLSRKSVDQHLARPGRFSMPSTENVVKEMNGGIPRLSFSFSVVERFIQERIGRGIVKRFPEWLGEQFEVIEESPVSFQILATILGSFAVLLTWLIVV